MERSREEWEKLRNSTSLYSNAIVHGVKTAKNMTVLQWQDTSKQASIDRKNNDFGRGRHGVREDEDYIKKQEEDIKAREFIMETYKEKELENRRDYEKFYNSLDDNEFHKVSSNLLYGATSTLLNPIEFTKNMAINGTIGAMTGGAGLVASFGANMLADTVDNFLSNTWEDELLGLKRETSDNIVQSIGGALVSNAVFPFVKFAGKKVLGLKGENIAIKGNTINEDILEPAVAKEYRKGLEEITAVDTSHRDFKITDSIKKEHIKAQATEEGTTRVFPKQEMKENIIKERTGVIPGIIDYQAMTEKILEISDDIGKELKTKQAKAQAKVYKNGGTEIVTLDDIAKKFNTYSRTKNAMDIVYTNFVAPMKVSQDGYNIANLKRMKEMHPAFNDTMSLSLKGQGYNDLLGDMLEEKTVVKEIANFRKKGITSGYAIKNAEGWNLKELGTFTENKNKNFYRAIENAVTYNVKENEALMLTNPRYQKYFSDTENLFQFENEIKDIFTDFSTDKIKWEEVAPLLEAKRTRYENIMLNLSNNDLSYESFITQVRLITENKDIDLDTLLKEIDETRKMKVESAIAKLSIDKAKALSVLSSKNAEEVKKVFGDNIYKLKGIKSEKDFNDELVTKLFYALNDTTKDVNKIKEDLKAFSSEDIPLSKYDLNNFINDFFRGKTKQARVDNFMAFFEPVLRDNWDMLNVMDKIIRNDQASMSSLGVPFKVIEDIVDNGGSFTEILRNIPQMRKYIMDDNGLIERLKNSHGYEKLSEELMNRLGNFIENEKIFKKTEDKTVIKSVLNTSANITRNMLLTASGVGEVLQHPFLASIKAVKSGANILTGVAVAPVSVVSTLYKVIEPLAMKSATYTKLYKNMAKLLQSENIDFSEELALMELGVNAKMLFGKGEQGFFGRTGKTLTDFAMYVQNAQQKNRYMASRLIGISTIKKYLDTDKFVDLKPTAKKTLSSLGIKDEESFGNWKSEVKAMGLKKALYEDGANEKTQLLHNVLTRNSYEEDAMSPLREQTQLNDITAKLKMMFTSYDRSLLNYLTDALEYAENDNGVYISRFSKEAMKYNLRDGGYGLAAFGLLGTAGLARQYLQSVAYGDSKDEFIEARVKSAYYGNTDSMKKLAGDFLENALPIGYFYQTGAGFSGSPIASVGSKFIDKMSEGNIIGAIAPPKIELLYNKYWGDKNYKKYGGMNVQEKYLYKTLVLQDKLKENKIKDFLHYAISDVIIDNLKKEELLTPIQALGIKRENGYNDIEIVEKLKDRGLDTVQTYAVLNSENPETVAEKLEMGIEKIANKKMTQKEIIEAMDEETGFDTSEKEILDFIESFNFKKEEYRQAEYEYYKKLVAEGHDQFEIIQKLTLYAFELYNK